MRFASRVAVWNVVVFAAAGASATPQRMLAQTREATTTRTSTPLLVVRTSGEAEVVRVATAPTAPPRLTVEQVKVYLTPLDLTVSSAPAKVTPAVPVAAGGRN